MLRRYMAWMLFTLVGCGRLGFGSSSGDGAVATFDDGGLGEDLVLPAGWTAEVWSDFSADYTYVDVQYLDVTFPMNNRPHHMVLLSPPFQPGIALIATWEVLEIRWPDTFIPHFYYPGTDDGLGPDALFDGVFCDAWMGTAPGICVAAGSQNTGDGVYRIEADWSMRRISTDNNVGDIAYDPTGAFDATGTPTVYWGGPTGLRQFGGAVFYPGMLNGAFTEVLPTGDLLLMNTDTTSNERRLVLVRSTTYTETVVRATLVPGDPVARQHAGTFAVVAGDVTRLPGRGYAIENTRDLLEVALGGTASVIASAGPGWRWTHAIVPPATHPLADGGWTFYILEFNPTTEVNRIIRLHGT